MSQDVFQPKLDATYQCIPNVTGIANDIIVAGKTPEEHDTAVISLLKACRANNIELNSDKLQFKQHKVELYGHTITDKSVQSSKDNLKAVKDIKSPENQKGRLLQMGRSPPEGSG